MERYEDYKDSGVEWIGEIPDSWQMVPNHVFLSNAADYVGNDANNHTLLSLTKQGVIIRTLDGSGKYPTSFDTYKIVHPGQMIFCLFDIDETPRTVGLCSHEGMITGAYDVFNVDTAICDRRFILYYYLTVDDGKHLRPYYRSLRKTLTPSAFLHVKAPLPSLQEQQAIADYLDARTAEIDAFVADCEREVELLREYRKAVVSEAVTKGLDPHAPMKDSGVEWIGEIPVDWKVLPSKVLFSEGKELRHTDDEQCAATQKYGIIPQAKYIALENQRMVAADKNLDAWKHVEPGNFVISLRSFQGGLELSEVTGCVTWHYIVLKKSDAVDVGFYKYLFKTQRYIESLQRTCTYIRDGQDLRYSNFIQVPLPLPPIEEQLRIGKELDCKTAEIDSLIEAKQQMAEKLREYRKSLISEAVTGKFKVPGVK